MQKELKINIFAIFVITVFFQEPCATANATFRTSIFKNLQRAWRKNKIPTHQIISLRYLTDHWSIFSKLDRYLGNCKDLLNLFYFKVKYLTYVGNCIDRLVSKVTSVSSTYRKVPYTRYEFFIFFCFLLFLRQAFRRFLNRLILVGKSPEHAIH